MPWKGSYVEMLTQDLTDLTGKLLIAMPGMSDPRFAHSIVLLCAHGDEGAMGLVVNKLAENVTFGTLLEQLEISHDTARSTFTVHFGGPVESGRGFVLHADDYQSNDSSLWFGDRFGMTATLDVLEDIAEARGPDRAILALGYAGWGPAQLEGELQENAWLVAEAAHDLVFDSENDRKWAAALQSLGIDPLTLSAAAGRA